MNRSTHRSRRKPWISPEWQAGLAAVASVLFGSWAADEGHELIDRFTGRGEDDDGSLIRYGVGFLVNLILFGFALVWLYRLRKVWTHPRTRLQQKKDPPAYPNLVLFLSNLNVDRGYQPNRGVPEGFQPTEDLDADIETLVQLKEREEKPIRWPWEMTLRGLRHHQGTLKRVIVFCSEKSLPQVHWLGDLLKNHYQSAFEDVELKVALRKGLGFRLVDCPTEAVLVRGPDDLGWDFEDFDSLSWGMIQLLNVLHDEGVSPNRVVIDFTGGQKPNSVVGAAVTFNRDTVCQYVRTEPPHRVIHYDLVLTPLEDEGI